MKCPYCESQDIRSYMDRDNDLHWYLCWNCRYQGYDLKLFYDGYSKNSAGVGETSQIDGVKIQKE